MKKYAIIVAGGSGKRMESAIPKQFMELNKEPILFHTLRKFYSFDKNIEIILALPKKVISLWKTLYEERGFSISHQIVEGGQTRFHSVKNALSKISENSLIAIHDGVRPLVSIDTINRCYTVAEKKGNAIPVVDIVDSIRELVKDKNKSLDRNNFKIIQTPQVFKSDILLNAYTQDYTENFTDDASVVENLGVKIHLVKGNKENIKITSPFDLSVAEIFIINS